MQRSCRSMACMVAPVHISNTTSAQTERVPKYHRILQRLVLPELKLIVQVLLEELQAAVQASPFGSITLAACCPGSSCDYLIIKVCFLARNAPCTAFLTLHKCSRDLSSTKLTQALLHATSNLLRIPTDRLAVWQVGLQSLTGFYCNVRLLLAQQVKLGQVCATRTRSRAWAAACDSLCQSGCL